MLTTVDNMKLNACLFGYLFIIQHASFKIITFLDFTLFANNTRYPNVNCYSFFKYFLVILLFSITLNHIYQGFIILIFSLHSKATHI